MSGSIEFYHILGIVCLEAALVCTVVGVVLFFRFHIPRTVSYLTGSRRKKGIQTMMQTSFIPPKAPYRSKPQQGVAVSEIVANSEEIGIYQEEKTSAKEEQPMNSVFQWGEELIATTKENDEDKAKKEEVWYFEQGEWKSKIVEVNEEPMQVQQQSDQEATTNLHLPYLDDGSETTTRLNTEKLYDGSEQTTKLDVEGVFDGSEQTTKLEMEGLFDGSERTTKLDMDDLFDGSERTTKLDMEGMFDGGEQTTKLDMEELYGGSERTTKLDLEVLDKESEETTKLGMTALEGGSAKRSNVDVDIA